MASNSFLSSLFHDSDTDSVHEKTNRDVNSSISSTGLAGNDSIAVESEHVSNRSFLAFFMINICAGTDNLQWYEIFS